MRSARRWTLCVFGRQFARNDMEQRGLAGAVAADETDARAVGHAHGSAVKQQAARNADGKIVDDQHARCSGDKSGAGKRYGTTYDGMVPDKFIGRPAVQG